MNTTNQTVLSLLAAMKAKAGMGSTAIAKIDVVDAQTLADFVNNTANSVETGLAALTIIMQNVSGATPIPDIIAAATTFDTFIYDSSATATTETTTTA